MIFLVMFYSFLLLKKWQHLTTNEADVKRIVIKNCIATNVHQTTSSYIYGVL